MSVPTVNNAGVLPYAYYNNTIYFLFGREHKEHGWSGGDKFSDFGGAVEHKHKDPSTLSEFGATLEDYPMITGATEFWEETLGLFYNKKETFKMLKDQKGIVVKGSNYYEHLLKVDYNPFWVELFRNAYNYVLSCAVPDTKKIGYMKIPSCPEGFTEKTEIKWFSYADVKEAVETGLPKSAEYRPELIGTLAKLFKMPEFAKLLDEASIFKDPSTVGFVAPVEPEKILPSEEYKWPDFYPEKTLINKGLVNSLTNHFSFLLATLPFIVKNPKEAQMFNYIDLINQLHYETKQFIYLKAVPGAGIKEAPVLNKAYWTNKYCPLADKSLTTTILGSGSYGTAYSATGPMTKCCGVPIKFVVKSTNKPPESSQLGFIQIDIPFADSIVPSGQKKTDIFATEVASLAFTNYLVTHSICYNLPYFYGAAHCVTDSNTYMYMQEFSTKFDSSKGKINDDEVSSMLLQGLMAIYALYKVKLVHGDINKDNLAYNLLEPAVTKRPVYKCDGKYFVGPLTNKILYLIDFGMGFIKDKLEPTYRLEKDKDRINNNINWTNQLKPFSTIIKSPAYEAYKGYFVNNSTNENAAFLRRHLLDLYLLFDTLNQKVGVTKMASANAAIRDYFMPYFANPVHFVSIAKEPMDKLMETIWKKIFEEIGKNTTVLVMDETEVQKLNPADLMFLGNLDIDI